MSIPQTKDSVQDTVEEGPTRYAAFAMRLRTLITASSRYVAYSSDIGEAFRPLTNPTFVRGAYAISWTYILGDVGYAGYRAHLDRQLPTDTTNLSPVQKVELRKRQLELAKGDQDANKTSESTHVGLIMARRAVFQSIASMALPAFTIHSIVRYSAPLFAKSSRPRVRASGPTVAGLAFVPALPFLFDEPVEHVIDTAFDWIEARIGHSTMTDKVKETKEKIKEKTDGHLNSISRAALIGIGVDTLHLPRLAALLSRHSRRLEGVNGTSTRSSTPLAIATERFVQKILHEKEQAEWKKKFSKASGADGSMGSFELKWLASRWAIKEAAFKAMPNHLVRFTWHDAIVTKVNNRPTIRHTPEIEKAWKKAGKGAFPSLHVSVTHDGDYVTAFVIAEEGPGEDA